MAEAITQEGVFVEKYRQNGWNILNKNKTGGIGGGFIKWSKDQCSKEAKKYKSRSEFQLNSRGAYGSARKNGYMDEICEHMIKNNKRNSGYWTKEKCKNEALKYNMLEQFKSESNGCFKSIIRNNWYDELCIHLVKKCKPNGYWTKENCIIEGKKYISKQEFYMNSKSAYVICCKNKWLDLIAFKNDNS